jgi:acyl carrier protein
VDRRALPAPDGQLAAADYVEPRGEAERRVAAVWAEVLGVERVGAQDDFFALGGHSLRATRVVAHVGRALGVEVPVRALFEAPVLADFAAAVEALAASGAADAAMPAIVTREEVEEVLAGVDDLSEAELDRLLSTLSTEDEAEW